MISHLNNKNKPQIVNISKKKKSNRVAIAQAKVKFSKLAYKKIAKMKTRKGEIINVSILAGILGAKKTSELIPLCHNIEINNIDLDVSTNRNISSIIVTATVGSSARTGVEMEALTAVSIASLTIYDMCKSIDKSIEISEIKLLSKKGGKSDYKKTPKN